ncbi:hypothetical protein IM543_13605 [Massilia sp. UMI-21]|nr:hypothetical protein IM543_13605 [Massilia sp. UMI-21]
MRFTESVSTCLRKYASFDGTAPRSEYRWFWLFLVVVALVLGWFSENLAVLFNLATLVPLIGWIVLVVFGAGKQGQALRHLDGRGLNRAPPA